MDMSVDEAGDSSAPPRSIAFAADGRGCAGIIDRRDAAAADLDIGPPAVGQASVGEKHQTSAINRTRRAATT